MTRHDVTVSVYPDLAAMNPVERAAHRWDTPQHWATCTCGWMGPMRCYLDAARVARRDADAHAAQVAEERRVLAEYRAAQDAEWWAEK